MLQFLEAAPTRGVSGAEDKAQTLAGCWPGGEAHGGTQLLCLQLNLLLLYVLCTFLSGQPVGTRVYGSDLLQEQGSWS